MAVKPKQGRTVDCLQYTPKNLATVAVPKSYLRLIREMGHRGLIKLKAQLNRMQLVADTAHRFEGFSMERAGFHKDAETVSARLFS